MRTCVLAAFFLLYVCGAQAQTLSLGVFAGPTVSFNGKKISDSPEFQSLLFAEVGKGILLSWDTKKASYVLQFYDMGLFLGISDRDPSRLAIGGSKGRGFIHQSLGFQYRPYVWQRRNWKLQLIGGLHLWNNRERSSGRTQVGGANGFSFTDKGLTRLARFNISTQLGTSFGFEVGERWGTVRIIALVVLGLRRLYRGDFETSYGGNTYQSSVFYNGHHFHGGLEYSVPLWRKK